MVAGGSPPPRPARRRRWLAAALALVLLAAVGAWQLEGAWGVRGRLVRVGVLVEQLQRDVARHDVAGARATLAALQGQARAAHRAVDAPTWRLAARLPGLGDDVAAVRTIAAVVDDLSHTTLPSILDVLAMTTVDDVVPAAGRVDLAPLRRVAAPLAGAAAATRSALDRVQAIPVATVAGPVRAAAMRLAAGLRRLHGLVDTAARAASALPSMLGDPAPRTYLVLFYNLAEVRASGGMPGAFLVLRADHGAVRIADEGTAGVDLGSFARPVLALTRAQRDLYTDRLGIFPADINFTPHFPTTAALAREMYRRRTGRSVDGVIATDPVALSYLLRATGPLAMPTGPALGAGNAVRVLLSQVYARFAAAPDQDRYFAAAARTVFDALSHGPVNPTLALDALAQAAHERRLLAWSAHPEEQRSIAGTVLEGALPEPDGVDPVIGVFLNDGTMAKLGYYLTHDAHASAGACRPDGRQEWRVRILLGSTAPRTGLSRSVLGLGLTGEKYTIRTNVMVFSPSGGSIGTVDLDGIAVPFGAGTERGRAVSTLAVDLKPGQQARIEVSLLGPPAALGPAAATSPPLGLSPPPAPLASGWHQSSTPQLWVTPGVNPWRLTADSARNCPTSR